MSDSLTLTTSPNGKVIFNGNGYAWGWKKKISPYEGSVVGEWDWAKKMTSTGGSQTGFSTATDASGNVYITGNFNGETSFGSFTLTSSPWDDLHNTDLFAAKFNPLGECLWAVQAGGNSPGSFSSSTTRGYKITIDSSGNAYIVGTFNRLATFGSITITTIDNSNYGGFVAKLSPSGEWLWVNPISTTGSLMSQSISIESNDIYISGHFSGTTTFDSTVLTAAGSADVFVARLNLAGEWQWVTQGGGANFEIAPSITTDSSGNAYITGYFSDTTNIGSTTLTSAGSADLFVAKINAAGIWQWAIQGGGISYDVGNSITSDSLGNLYVTGEFSGSATFGSTTLTGGGSRDVFVAKIDTLGNWEWAIDIINAGMNRGFSITTDILDDIYVTGSFQGTVDVGSTSLIGVGTYNIFVAKVNQSGEWQWAAQAGGTNNSCLSYDLATDNSNNIYVTGFISNTIDFGTHSLTAPASSNIFLAKLKQVPA